MTPMNDTERERIDVVRTKRAAEEWRADLPSAAEIARARRRLLASRAPRRSRKLWTLALVQGFALGIASLAAASFVASRVFRAPAQTLPAPAVSAAPQRPALAHPRHLSAPRSEEPAGTVLPPPTASFDDVQRAAPAPGFAPSAPTTPRTAVAGASAPSTSAPGASSIGSSNGAFPLVPVPDLPSSQGPWGRVAEALAAGDYHAADRGLVALAASGDPTTRDEAELARAELWVGRGASDGLRPTIERLAVAGHTPLIRRRAAALLNRLR